MQPGRFPRTVAIRHPISVLRIALIRKMSLSCRVLTFDAICAGQAQLPLFDLTRLILPHPEWAPSRSPNFRYCRSWPGRIRNLLLGHLRQEISFAGELRTHMYESSSLDFRALRQRSQLRRTRTRHPSVRAQGCHNFRAPLPQPRPDMRETQIKIADRNSAPEISDQQSQGGPFPRRGPLMVAKMPPKHHSNRTQEPAFSRRASSLADSSAGADNAVPLD